MQVTTTHPLCWNRELKCYMPCPHGHTPDVPKDKVLGEWIKNSTNGKYALVEIKSKGREIEVFVDTSCIDFSF